MADFGAPAWARPYQPRDRYRNWTPAGGVSARSLGLEGPATRGSSSTTGKNSVRGAKDKLQKQIDAIMASNAPRSEKEAAAAAAVAKGHSHNYLEPILKVLGKPAAVVEGGEEQINRAVGQAALALHLDKIPGLGVDDAQRARIEGRKPSLTRFRQDVAHPQGFGHALKERQIAPKNRWAAAGLGFAGDVAMDPLTYLAPEAVLERLGSEGVARGALQASERLAATGTEEGLAHAATLERTAQVAKGGTSGLSKEQLAHLSEHAAEELGLHDGQVLKGGLYLNRPGTGRLSRGLAGKLGKDIAQEQLQLLPRSEALELIPRLASGALRGAKGTNLYRGLADFMSAGESRNLRSIMQNPETDAHGFADAFRANDARNSGNLQGTAFSVEQGQKLDLLHHDLNKARMVGEDVTHALEGSTEAQARMEAKLPGSFDRVRAFNDQLREAANGRVGEDFIKYREDHAPAMLSDKMGKELFDSAKKEARKAGVRFDAAGFEQKARLVDGGEFMGHDIVAADAHPEGLTPRQQAQQIFDESPAGVARQAASGDLPIFENNWFKASQHQVSTMSKRVGEKFTEQRLLEMGIAKPLFAESAQSVHDVAQASVVRNHQADVVAQATRQEADAAVARALAHEADAAVGATEAAGTARVGAARTAAMDAASKVGDTLDGAAGVREYAGILRDQADHHDQQFWQLATDAREAANPPELAALQAHADIAVEHATAAQGKLTRLREYRNELQRKLVTAQTHAELRVRQALDAPQLADDIAQLDQEIAVHEAVVRAVGRDPQAIQSDLNAVATKTAGHRAETRQLEDWLVRLRTRGDQGVHYSLELKTGVRNEAERVAYEAREAGITTDLSKLDAELQGRFDNAMRNVTQGNRFTASLQAELEGSVSANGEGAAARSQVDELKALRDQSQSELDALDPQQRALADVHGQNQATEAKPVLTFAGPGGEPQTVVYHGTPTSLNLVDGPVSRQFAEIDVLEGTHWTEHQGVAQDFAKFGDTPPEVPGGRIASAELHMSNPMDYSSPDWLGGDGDPYGNEFFGRNKNPSRVAWRNEMFNLGVTSGILTPETLAGSLHGIDAEERALWSQVFEAHTMGNTKSLDQAIANTFSHTPFDPVAATRDAGEGGMFRADDFAEHRDAGMVAPDPRTIDAVKSIRLNDLHPDVKQQLAAAHVADLQRQGFDGIKYQMADGGNAYVAFDPSTVQATADHNPAAITDWWDKEKAATDVLMRQYHDLRSQVAQVGDMVVEANGTAADASAYARENQVSLGRLRQRIARTLEPMNTRARDLANEEAALRTQADHGFALADQMDAGFARTQQINAQAADQAAMASEQDALYATHDATVTALRLHATADAAEATARATGDYAKSLDQVLAGLPDTAKMEKVARDGFSQLGIATQAPDAIVEALTNFSKFSDPEGLKGLLRVSDYLTNLFKSYAVTTPGFHVRNYMGGMFNNYLAGVDVGIYRRFGKAQAALASGDVAAAGSRLESDMEHLRNIQNSGVLTGSQSHEIAPLLHGGSTRESPIGRQLEDNAGLLHNPLTRLNARAMGSVENRLRGALALDVMDKGGSMDEAISQVFKYHFNYDDLSGVESGVMRRVIPFYTWTRNNLPLQLEQMALKPGKYVKIMYAKRAIEDGLPEQSLVPSYFGGQSVAANTGINVGGGDVYAMPDLPFVEPLKYSHPTDVLSQLNPQLKVPLELLEGKQNFSGIPFRKGYQPVPQAWSTIGLTRAMEAFGMIQRDSHHRPLARDQSLYAIEQFLPLAGRARRLAPSEPKYNNRLWSSALSMLFGVSARTNTLQDQISEANRRRAGLLGTETDLQDRGLMTRPWYSPQGPYDARPTATRY